MHIIEDCKNYIRSIVIFLLNMQCWFLMRNIWNHAVICVLMCVAIGWKWINAFRGVDNIRQNNLSFISSIIQLKNSENREYDIIKRGIYWQNKHLLSSNVEAIKQFPITRVKILITICSYFSYAYVLIFPEMLNSMFCS